MVGRLQVRPLSRGRDSCHRGTRRDRRRAGRRRPGVPPAGAARRRSVRAGDHRPGGDHRSRRGGVRRCRAGRDRRRCRQVDPLRIDVERRRRHGAVLADDRCRRPVDRRVGSPAADAARPGPRASGHRHDRPHPRGPCRADHVRGEGRPVGAPGRSRSPATAGGSRHGRRDEAERGGRHLLQHPTVGRGVRGRRARIAPGRRHAGDRPRSPQRVPVCVRIDRGDVRADGGRAASSAAHRGARGAGGFQAGPEGFVGDAPQT